MQQRRISDKIASQLRLAILKQVLFDKSTGYDKSWNKNRKTNLDEVSF